jgi:hypothetical protein
MTKGRWSPRPALDPQIRVCWRLAPDGKVYKSRAFVGKAAVLEFARTIKGDLCELWAENDEKRSARFDPKNRDPLEGEDWLFIDY